MSELFDVGKLIRGFNPLSGEKLGKLLYYLAIVVVCLFVFWKLFVAPTHKTTTQQKAENITNNTTTINQVENAFELSIVPPKIKIGGFKLMFFDKK